MRRSRTVLAEKRRLIKSKQAYDITRDILTAIKVCTSLQDLERGKRVHAFVVGSGLHTDSRVATGLVNMFVKCKSMGDARKAFDSIPQPNEITWSSLLLGYAEHGEAEEALELFSHMGRKGFALTSRTLVSALTACTWLADNDEVKLVNGEAVKALCLEKALVIHQHIMKHGCDSNVIVSNALMNLFCKCGILRNAQEVFNKMVHRNTVSWTALISGYAEQGHSEMALELYESMKTEPEFDCTPDSRTLSAVITACTGLAEKEQAREMHGKLAKAGALRRAFCIHASQDGCVVFTDVYVGTGLVNLYARCGSMEDSRAVFDRMQFHDVVSWNALVHGYAENGEPELALELFDCMTRSADARTYVAALTACSCLTEKERAAEKVTRKPGSLVVHRDELSYRSSPVNNIYSKVVNTIHSKAMKLGFDRQLYVANALITAYASCGNMKSAREVFDAMERQHRDVVSWTSLVLGYADNGEPRVALKLLFEQMDVEPNPLTFVAGLTACIASVDLQSGRRLHAWIYRTVGLESNTQLAASLLGFYASSGAVNLAQHLFDCLTDTCTDITTRNALLSAYSRQGDAEQALRMFSVMREQGQAPNGVTFLGLLTACSHAGLVDVGWRIFSAMREKFGFIPGLDHFHCMVDMLARGNRLTEAVEVVQSMPFTPDECTWTIILGACHKWKNVELGRFAFERLVEVNAAQPSAYVLMGNIYASAGMWEEQLEVLSRMNSGIST